MTKLGSYTILTIVCSFLIVYSNLYAGQVTNILSVVGPGLESWDFWEIDFDRLNNDNASNSDPTIPVADNFVQIFKTFGNIAYVDTVFQVADTGGTTEFQLDEYWTANHTGICWKGFYWELGFGTGSNFVQSDSTDQLDFDTPDKDPMPYSNIFSTANHLSDSIMWYLTFRTQKSRSLTIFCSC
jgi:hypothetical protein